MTTPIIVSLHGQPAAIAASDQLALLGTIAVLEHDHPHRRFVEAMGLYALALSDEDRGREYTDLGAENFAREALLPAARFLDLDREGVDDAQLAEAFMVPLEQIAIRREDLIPGAVARGW